MNGKQFEFLRGEWPALFDPAVRTAEWLAEMVVRFAPAPRVSRGTLKRGGDVAIARQTYEAK
jgi:hypothetical protein